MKRISVVCLALGLNLLTIVGSAGAETTKICVPEKPSKPVLSASAKDECPTKSTTKYKTVALPGTVELETLDKVLPHVTLVESGVAGKPTIQFSGVNVQIVNGEGKTASTNGEGNLVIGYDEFSSERQVQTGSHDLLLGEEQTFTSYGGIVAGRKSSVLGPFASVTGGVLNAAKAESSSVSGGQNNVATGFTSSITGGQLNEAGFIGSINGGVLNKTTGGSSWVGGGQENDASGEKAAIFGGHGLTASNEYEAIP